MTAPSVTVARAGSLVLGLLAENSANVEVESAVVASGASKWFFQSHQTTITHTHLVTFIDTAAAGVTTPINATYPGSTSTEASGVQIVFPGSEIPPPPIPSSRFAGTFGFGSTWLTMGARVEAVAGQVRVDAVPVDGGATVVSAGLSTPDTWGWVSCRVNGLNPNIKYNLTMVDVTTGTAVATVQATTTGGIRDDFKVVTSSCQLSNHDALAYVNMAAEGAAFYEHQGDLHYQDATTELSWRFGVNSNMAQPAMKAFLATTPMAYRWDNHDWAGNKSWRESPPKDYAPQAIRNLMGVETFADETGIYRTWTHNGVRFIDTDNWTLRDEADTTPETNFAPGKTMWGLEQRQWFFDTLLAATEPLVVWFSSFPLYGNWVSNGRWGNFRDEAAIIQSWFDAHPEVHEKIVAIGGDSHNIRADDGTNTMWGIPSLNASPVGREGDTDGSEMSSPLWNICCLPASGVAGGVVSHGVYSLLSFDWNTDRTQVTFTWQAKRTGGAVAATWSKTFTDPTFALTAGLYRWDGVQEQPMGAFLWNGTAEVPMEISVNLEA